MRWNHKIGTFTVLLALGITMAGCGASSSTAGSTAASTPSTTSSEAQEAQKTEVQPMQGVLLSGPRSEGTNLSRCESQRGWVGEGKKHSGFHGKHDIFGGAKNGSTPNARCFTE